MLSRLLGLALGTHPMAVVGNHWVLAGSVTIYQGAKLCESSESTRKGFAVTFLKYRRNPVTCSLVCYICVIWERIHFSLTGTFTARKNRTSELSRALWMVWACDTSALQQRWKGARRSGWHGPRPGAGRSQDQPSHLWAKINKQLLETQAAKIHLNSLWHMLSSDKANAKQ